jgi:hypothetical protein
MKNKKFEDFPLNWFVVFTGYEEIIEGMVKKPRCAFRYETEAQDFVKAVLSTNGYYEQNVIEE